MRVDYLGLEAFVAIADCGSFQRAAEVLNLSQAALSHRLRKIEEDLGSALLHRTSREVTLTAVGQEVLPEARRLLKGLQDTYEAARSFGRKRAARFSFACLPTLANAVLPAIVSQMQAEQPDLAFDMLDIPVARIAEAVRSGAAEFGVTVVSAEMSDLRFRPLCDENYMLFVRHDHPLADRPSVSLEDIEPLPMVRISSQSKNRQLLDIAFGQMRDRMRWQFEVQSATAAMRLVSHGMAVTILPESAIAMAPSSLRPVPFHGVRLQRSLGIMQRRAVPLSDGASQMLERIEAVLQKGVHDLPFLTDDRGSRPRG